MDLCNRNSEKILAFEWTADPKGLKIPLVVRMKLDLAGAKISLSDWQALPSSLRQLLARKSVESTYQARSFLLILNRLMVEHGCRIARRLSPADARVTKWLGYTEPQKVRLLRLSAGVGGDWAVLSRFERFLLCHAARKNDVFLCRSIAAQMPSLTLSRGLGSDLSQEPPYCP